MATYEQKGLLTLKDTEGDTHQVYPITKDECVTLSNSILTAYGLAAGSKADEVLAKLASGVLYSETRALSDLSPGDEFTLNESGSPVTFIKLKDNYEGSGRTLVLRKDLHSSRQWHTSGVNAYATSAIDTWLNGTYLATLDSAVQSDISAVAIPYTPGNGNNTVTTLARKVFLLSLTELGVTNTYANTEGAALPYFSGNAKRIAYLSGAAAIYSTRSPMIAGSNQIWYMDTSGICQSNLASSSYGVRPALTLPADFDVGYVVESSLTDVLGNKITIGAQIATGSYIGTGTYGSANPNSLTFDSIPEIIFFEGVSTDSPSTLLFGCFITDCPIGLVIVGGSIATCNVTWGTTVSWYNTVNTGSQMNSNGYKVRYKAVFA